MSAQKEFFTNDFREPNFGQVIFNYYLILSLVFLKFVLQNAIGVYVCEQRYNSVLEIIRPTVDYRFLARQKGLAKTRK